MVYEGTFAINWLLSIHFGLSLIAFASVVLLTIRIFELGREQREQPARLLATSLWLQILLWTLAVYTYLVVYTGAYVEHTGAVVGCGIVLPGCGSTYLPSLVSLPGIQVLHRYAAALLWFGVLFLLIAVLRRYRTSRTLVVGAWWSMILVTLQALVGVFNVLTVGQMLPALIHSTLVSILFAVLCYLCAQVGWPGRREPSVRQIEGQAVEPEAVSNRR